MREGEICVVIVSCTPGLQDRRRAEKGLGDNKWDDEKYIYRVYYRKHDHFDI